jgi:hypothetical protein
MPQEWMGTYWKMVHKVERKGHYTWPPENLLSDSWEEGGVSTKENGEEENEDIGSWKLKAVDMEINMCILCCHGSL